jgi:hypothetical protein
MNQQGPSVRWQFDDRNLSADDLLLIAHIFVRQNKNLERFLCES